MFKTERIKPPVMPSRQQPNITCWASFHASLMHRTITDIPTYISHLRKKKKKPREFQTELSPNNALISCCNDHKPIITKTKVIRVLISFSSLSILSLALTFFTSLFIWIYYLSMYVWKKVNKKSRNNLNSHEMGK